MIDKNKGKEVDLKSSNVVSFQEKEWTAEEIVTWLNSEDGKEAYVAVEQEVREYLTESERSRVYTPRIMNLRITI